MYRLVSRQGWQGSWLSSLLGGFKGSQGASMGGMLGSESDSGPMAPDTPWWWRGDRSPPDLGSPVAFLPVKVQCGFELSGTSSLTREND